MPELFDFLEEEQCADVRAALFSFRNLWHNRTWGAHPFYTLGAASYLDADKGEYLEEAKKLNPLLLKTFPTLYKRLCAIVAEETGEPALIEESFAVPGFHIFLYDKLFERPVAKVHFDLQFQKLNWPYKEVDRSRPLSFTGAIKLPRSGGGLTLWEIRYDPERSPDETERLKESASSRYIPYKEGKLLLLNQLLLHQIAPTKEILPGDERITFQGHGLFCDGAWRLYW